MIPTLLKAGRAKLLTASLFLLALTAFFDWAFGKSVSLAAFYILPIMLGAVVMPAHEIAVYAVLCSYLRSQFETPGAFADQVIRFVFAVLAYLASGFFVTGLVRNHELTVEHLDEMRREQSRRREAEEQLRLLAESSPAAILTLGPSGEVLSANRSAEILFAIQEGQTLVGRSIREFMPVLAEAVDLDMGPSNLRTAAQAQGQRSDGEIFFAQTWFSSYQGPSGRRLAAIVVDSSEELREREEQGLREFLAGNRIAAAALAHEVRNFCGAISMLCARLAESSGPARNDDLGALAQLASGLESIAALDLQARTQDVAGDVPLKTVLDNLRIVVEPDWREIGGVIRWELPKDSPVVLADPHGLLQAFLNLVHNSHRAVQEGPERRELTVCVTVDGARAVIRFQDSGPGVAAPERLFQPFQPGAAGSGLGLYVSRSIVRSYGGELRYEPRPAGSCFAVELQTVTL